MAMPVEVVAADPRIKGNIGKRAIQRGPLVYCIEETDNAKDFDKLTLSPTTSFNNRFDTSLLNGVVSIQAIDGDRQFSLIPYYSWDNREAGKMKVWIDYKE